MVSVMPHFTTGKPNTEVWHLPQLKRLRELEEENARLKRMYADLSLVHHALKDAVEKKL
jgi:putative transposase